MKAVDLGLLSSSIARRLVQLKAGWCQRKAVRQLHKAQSSPMPVPHTWVMQQETCHPQTSISPATQAKHNGSRPSEHHYSSDASAAAMSVATQSQDRPIYPASDPSITASAMHLVPHQVYACQFGGRDLASTSECMATCWQTSATSQLPMQLGSNSPFAIGQKSDMGPSTSAGLGTLGHGSPTSDACSLPHGAMRSVQATSVACLDAGALPVCQGQFELNGQAGAVQFNSNEGEACISNAEPSCIPAMSKFIQTHWADDAQTSPGNAGNATTPRSGVCSDSDFAVLLSWLCPSL
jgi:hypothetical protein